MKRSIGLTGILAVMFLAMAVAPAAANDGNQAFLPEGFSAFLIGYEEVPPVFTSGSGTLQIQISQDRTSIFYQLSYSGLSSAVTQAHIHFAQRPVNGGIIVLLCDNTGNAPSGVPACPNSGTVTGTLTAAVVNPPKDPEPVTAQGIAAGDLPAFLARSNMVTPTAMFIRAIFQPERFAAGSAEIIRAIRARAAYANVHTVNHPGGEIRGRLDEPND